MTKRQTTLWKMCSNRQHRLCCKKQFLRAKAATAIACLSHCNSVCPSVCQMG